MRERGAGGVFEGASAVMPHRREPGTSLDFFPTPPWATRALAEHVLFGPLGQSVIKTEWSQRASWDPCSGDLHMSKVLAEYFSTVHASDVHDYGHGARVGSFVGDGADVILPPGPVNWTIFNPPFNLALDFVERGLSVASDGVAALVRSVWAEGGERYEQLFWRRPPTLIAQFCERVNMCKGRWDPDGSTATSYAWFVWAKACEGSAAQGDIAGTRFVWIPPGRKSALERPTDRARFAPWSLSIAPADELERIARGLCELAGVDPDTAGYWTPRFHTLPYVERRGAKPMHLVELVCGPRWRASISDADNIWARRLQAEVWANEARSVDLAHDKSPSEHGGASA